MLVSPAAAGRRRGRRACRRSARRGRRSAPQSRLVMNSFSPLTIYSSPSSVAVVFRAVRSEPAPGSVSAKPDSAWPLASLGRKRSFLFGRAEGAHRIDGADAAVDRRHARDHRVLRRHLGQEVREALERCALAAVLAVDEQAPIAGVTQFAQHGRRDLALFIVDRAGGAVTGDNLVGLVHRRITGGRRRQCRRLEQLQRHRAVQTAL